MSERVHAAEDAVAIGWDGRIVHDQQVTEVAGWVRDCTCGWRCKTYSTVDGAADAWNRHASISRLPEQEEQR